VKTEERVGPERHGCFETGLPPTAEIAFQVGYPEVVVHGPSGHTDKVLTLGSRFVVCAFAKQHLNTLLFDMMRRNIPGDSGDIP